MAMKPTYEELEQTIRQLEEDTLIISKAQKIQSSISKIVKPEFSLEEIIEKVINLIPNSSLNPTIICARSIVNDQEYRTYNFHKTKWKYKRELMSNDQTIGFLEFYSLEERTSTGNGFFLDSEIYVFEGIANRLEHIIEHRQIMASLQRSDANLAVAQRIAHLGSWNWDVVNNNFYLSDELYRVFGINPEDGKRTDETYILEKVSQQVHPDDIERYKRCVKEFMHGSNPLDMEFRIMLSDDSERYVHVQGTQEFDSNGRIAGRIGTVLDITKQKKVEKELKKRERELMNKSNSLEEMNAALRVLLKQREEDKSAIEENVLMNVKELIDPYIEKLKGSQLNDDQKTLIEILESNLNDIVSPFIRNLSISQFHFTPMEIEVANLVRHGRSSKEISKILNLSKKTVDTHRDHIRKKLGLKNKIINLRSHLLLIR